MKTLLFSIVSVLLSIETYLDIPIILLTTLVITIMFGYSFFASTGELKDKNKQRFLVSFLCLVIIFLFLTVISWLAGTLGIGQTAYVPAPLTEQGIMINRVKSFSKEVLWSACGILLIYKAYKKSKLF